MSARIYVGYINLQGKQYRLDPHAESGVQGELVSKVSVSHSRVHDIDLLIDIGLLASGLGTIVLLEHLADLVLHSRLQQKSDLIQQRGFRNALAGAARELPSATKPLEHKSLGQQLRDKLAKAGFDEGVSPEKGNPLSQKDPVQAAAAGQQTTVPRSRSPAR